MDDLPRSYMLRALALAEQGRGWVEPNPLVGAVVVKDGTVVGAGWHQRYGQPHAEVNALAAAGDLAHDAALYVTLEPCCHWGKTPPCTEAILRAGIRRVIAALRDPFPQVSGRGFDQLREYGVTVEDGLCDAEARRQNAPYLKLITTRRPYVLAKWAMTLDGKISTRTGESQWISNQSVLNRTRAQRGLLDAIVVGIGTALADDPQLTPRPPGPRTPLRIVLDRQARLPITSRLVQTARMVPVLVVTGPAAAPSRVTALQELGVEVLPLKTLDRTAAIHELLEELGRRRLTNLLVEGGGEVLGSFLDAGEIDEVQVCIAPRLVGGLAARSPIAGLGSARLGDALRLTDWQVETVDDNLLLRGWR